MGLNYSYTGTDLKFYIPTHLHFPFKVLCSVFAGVYNEYIIKGAGADIHIMIQNVFMYLDSIFCNVALLSVKVNIRR